MTTDVKTVVSSDSKRIQRADRMAWKQNITTKRRVVELLHTLQVIRMFCLHRNSDVLSKCVVLGCVPRTCSARGVAGGFPMGEGFETSVRNWSVHDLNPPR